MVLAYVGVGSNIEPERNVRAALRLLGRDVDVVGVSTFTFFALSGLSLKHDLVAHDVCREIAPGNLDVAAIGRYLALQFPGHAFPRQFADTIHQRTEGHHGDLLGVMAVGECLKMLPHVGGVECHTLRRAYPSAHARRSPCLDSTT